MTDLKTILSNVVSAAPPDPSSDEAQTDQALSSTLMRGLEILSLYSDREDHLSNSDIARRLDLNKATVSRLCKTLVHMGYLRRDAKGAFRLAPRILSLSYPILASTRWRHQLSGPMREIAEMSAGNVTLAVISGDCFVQVHTVGEPTSFPHVPEPGVSGPLHRSASGRALLALLQDDELTETLALVRSHNPADFAVHAEATAAAIARCRSQGFCTAYGDWRPNIAAISAPLGETEDGLRVALSCGIPRFRAKEDQMENDLGPRMAEAANSIRASGLILPPFYLRGS